MKLSFVAGAAIGYVLGARAGRRRYDTIVRLARRLAGSQTVQASAGVLQAQLDAAVRRARDEVSAALRGPTPTPPPH